MQIKMRNLMLDIQEKQREHARERILELLLAA